VSLPQKQNNPRFALTILFVCLFAALPFPVFADLSYYDPDFDVSMGLFHYTSKDIEEADVYPGLYFGGYYSGKSFLLTNYFNTKQLYTIYEAGIVQNGIDIPDYENENMEGAVITTIPLHADLAFRIRVTRRFFLSPFVGTGIHFVYCEPAEDQFRVHPVLQFGAEFRYRLWSRTSLKLKFDYGYAFDSRYETGFIRYLRVRFPFPFIP